MLNRVVLSLCAAVALTACSDGGTTIVSGGGGGNAGSSGESSQQAAGTYAVPQEELARNADAIKLSGTIAVKDYESGYLQIDVTKPTEGGAPTQGVPPITVARFKTPGPFELLLPPKTESVNLNLILDLKGDGPGAGDPQVSYAQNPVKISGKSVTGIELSIDKTPVAPPPTPPADQSATGGGTPAVTGVDALSATVGGGTAAPVAAGAPGTPGGAPGTTGAAPGTPGAAAGTAGTTTGTPGTAPAATPPAGTAPGAASKPGSSPGATSPAAPAGGTTGASSPTGSSAVRPTPQSSSTSGNPPGVTPVPVKGSGTGKTAIDVLDEALDGAPKAAKPGP